MDFRSPLEQKWYNFFRKNGLQCSYLYKRGNPPEFYVWSGKLKIFITVTHFDTRLWDAQRSLCRQIQLIRGRFVQFKKIPILALGNEILSKTDIGMIHHYIDNTQDEVCGEVNIKLRGKTGNILFWRDVKSGRWFSDFTIKAKPDGWYYHSMDLSKTWYKTTKHNRLWTMWYQVNDRFKIARLHDNFIRIVDDYLWKPPHGLMIRVEYEKGQSWTSSAFYNLSDVTWQGLNDKNTDNSDDP